MRFPFFDLTYKIGVKLKLKGPTLNQKCFTFQLPRCIRKMDLSQLWLEGHQSRTQVESLKHKMLSNRSLGHRPEKKNVV